MLEIRVLGPVEVRRSGRPVALRRRERALVALLALRAGEAVAADTIVDALWGPSPPKTAAAALHNAVSRVRKRLGAGALVTRAPGYALDVQSVTVDAHRFEQLLGAARATSAPADRLSLLGEALSLWRGRSLSDLEDEPFAATASGRLDELRLAAREELAEAEVALGRHVEALAEIEALVAEHPFSERARALLVLALYRCGRQADALDAYRTTRTFLHEELGLEPSPELRRLETAVLRQDPALDAPFSGITAVLLRSRRATVSVVVIGPEEIGPAGEVDAEAYASALRAWQRPAREAFEAHGGGVERFGQEALACIFGLPRRREDDAHRAVRAAMDALARAGVTTGGTPACSAAVATGEAVAAAGDTGLPRGYVVAVAAKLQQAAGPGVVLLDPATHALVRGAVDVADGDPVRVRPGGTEVRSYAVHAVDVQAPAIPRRLDAALVGRADELATLRAAFAGALAERRPRIVTLLGDPGIGKSRLAAELARAVRDQATVVVGRCAAYGEGATYRAVAEIVAQLAGGRSEARVAGVLRETEDSRSVIRRLRQLLGWAPGAPPPGEGWWAVRRLLEEAASRHPMLAVVEDVHWAEEELLDLVEHVVARARDVPLVIACLARSELRERRPEWPVTLALEPLRGADASELAARAPGGATLSAGALERIVSAAEGNALFVEQLVAHAVEAGEDTLVEMPPSIESLLASRVDRLRDEERDVLERAAVVGVQFDALEVAALGEPDVTAPLQSSCAAGLVRDLGDGTFRFAHGLIREAAYRAATKERRARQHELAAEWLDTHGDGGDEIVGFHLEQACRLGREIAADEGALDALAARAGERLGEAGLTAWKRLDLGAAVDLLSRAAALLPPGRRRAGVLIERALALVRAGKGDDTLDVLAEARRIAQAAGDEVYEAWAELEAAHAQLYAGESHDPDELLARTARVLQVLDAHGDERVAGRTWLVIAAAHAMRMHTVPWAEGAERALFHYRSAGWPVPAPTTSLATAILWGPLGVDDALARCRALLDQADEQSSRAGVLTAMAVLNAMQDDAGSAEGALAEARGIWDDLGWTYTLAIAWDGYAAEAARLRGDPSSAREILTASCDRLLAMNQHAFLSTRAAELAALELDEGDAQAAGAARRLAREHAAPYDVLADVLLATVDGRLAVQRGFLIEGLAAAQRAVLVADGTDAPVLRAASRLGLASVLVATGDEAGAHAAAARAEALLRAKGNVVDAARAAELVERVTP